MHIEVYSLVIWRFIHEAEAMDSSLLNYELKLITSLISRITDLSAIRILNLPLVKMVSQLEHLVKQGKILYREKFNSACVNEPNMHQTRIVNK